MARGCFFRRELDNILGFLGIRALDVSQERLTKLDAVLGEHMGYSVKIKNNETGEVRDARMDFDWHDGSDYWWTEGNFGCDCNRHLVFIRAGNEPESDVSCGNKLYTVIHAKLDDGKVIEIDGITTAGE